MSLDVVWNGTLDVAMARAAQRTPEADHHEVARLVLRCLAERPMTLTELVTGCGVDHGRLDGAIWLLRNQDRIKFVKRPAHRTKKCRSERPFMLTALGRHALTERSES